MNFPQRKIVTQRMHRWLGTVVPRKELETDGLVRKNCNMAVLRKLRFDIDVYDVHGFFATSG